ncbi:MAG: zinc-binding alcohol dehydrogenase [Verrucomicrobia bacterium]|nr:zinc-binding alcohol dehydrogenase [Verrucomicrobiota bacterium]
MRAKRVVFTEPHRAVLEEFELDDNRLGEQEILVRTLCSVISAGTEGAAFTGLEAEHPGARNFGYPCGTGYGNVGEILKVGKSVEGLKEGDIAFTTAPHASRAKFNTYQRICVKAPDGLDLKQAVFARMAGVAITAVRKADFSLGDPVLVIGLGLVGNFAAQEFLLAGADVMGVDVAEPRLEKAPQCGIANVVNPQKTDLQQAVNEWTDGKGARVVVEAIGQPELIAQAAQLARRHGDIILLGSPRRRVTMDVTPMLSRIHLQGLNVKGALEWLYSIPELDAVRHSIIGNTRQIFGWLKSGRLKTEPLLTHLLPPTECQQAYSGLDKKKDEYLGVVFDWTAI